MSKGWLELIESFILIQRGHPSGESFPFQPPNPLSGGNLKVDDYYRSGFHKWMGQPQVSVVIPVWNGERYLREAIESVRSQNVDGLEIILVDDGSTDATGAILQDYSHDCRIRVHRQTNQGLVAALNVGLRIAQAKYIARLDADDVCMPGRLAAQLRYLEGHPAVLAVGGAIEMIDERGRSKGRRAYPVGQVAATSGMLKGCTLAHPAVMMRKDAVQKAGGYRAVFTHAEDYDLWLRLIERGPVDNLAGILIKYRIHPESVTQKHGISQSLSAAAALVAYRRRVQGLPDPFDSLESALKIEMVLQGGFSNEEQAAFAYVRFRLLAEKCASTCDYLAALNWAWNLRSHIPRGRLVRHCLAPAISALRKAGRTGQAIGWFARAFVTEPASACWMLLR